MKISKLFHWLYALLMFLPLFVFLPSAFYYGFNSGAVAPQYVKTPLYQTNEVDTLDDLHVNNVYHLDSLLLQRNNCETDYFFAIDILNCVSLETDYIQYGIDEVFVDNYNSKTLNYLYVDVTHVFLDNYDFGYLSFTNLAGYTTVEYIFEDNDGFLQFNDVDFFIENSTLLDDFAVYCNYYGYLPSASDFQAYDYSENGSITTAMCQAWEDVWHNDLFSWSYDTFLTRPFKYITDMFSIPQDNVLINCFSYWLTISIVWLCFDVIIYVPQIAHRWLDKASLE